VSFSGIQGVRCRNMAVQGTSAAPSRNRTTGTSARATRAYCCRKAACCARRALEESNQTNREDPAVYRLRSMAVVADRSSTGGGSYRDHANANVTNAERPGLAPITGFFCEGSRGLSWSKT